MSGQIDANTLVGKCDVLFITLDTLRYDVAQTAHELGETPFLSSLLPKQGWQARHTPGSFTYAAHHAFFAGFLPTPVDEPDEARLLVTRFAGSVTTADTSCVFDTPDIVSGFAERGYHTICIGGVGFFNKCTPLARVLPQLFAESHWCEDFGVACPQSTHNQVEQAIASLKQLRPDQRAFVFMNVSACHQPNRFYLDGATQDSPESQRAALGYVDRQLPPLFDFMRSRAPVLAILCSDHGTAYGEDGYDGHRLAHPIVWTVPYHETVLEQTGGRT